METREHKHPLQHAYDWIKNREKSLEILSNEEELKENLKLDRLLAENRKQLHQITNKAILHTHEYSITISDTYQRFPFFDNEIAAIINTFIESKTPFVYSKEKIIPKILNKQFKSVILQFMKANHTKSDRFKASAVEHTDEQNLEKQIHHIRTSAKALTNISGKKEANPFKYAVNQDAYWIYEKNKGDIIIYKLPVHERMFSEYFAVGIVFSAIMALSAPIGMIGYLSCITASQIKERQSLAIWKDYRAARMVMHNHLLNGMHKITTHRLMQDDMLNDLFNRYFARSLVKNQQLEDIAIHDTRIHYLDTNIRH